MRKDVRTALAAYSSAAAISVLAAVVLLQLRGVDLRVPFDYGGDALSYGLVVKSVVDHGWYLTNPDVGAPSGLSFYDFPFVANDTAQILVIKAMSLFSKDWGLLFNLYFLLGFPLITLTAMAVFRSCRVAYGPAAAGAVLYSFLPSRVLKGEGHLFLDVFWAVPLGLLVALWVCSDDPPLARAGPSRWPRIDLRSKRSLLAVAFCVLAGSSSLYYSFFTALLLVAGGAWASLDRRSTRNALSGLALTGVVGLSIVANLAPSLIAQLRHGANASVGQRDAAEAEFYGMRITQLLLPVDGHRLAAFDRLKHAYNAGAPLLGENSSTSLGVAGSIGFLALLVVLLVRPRREGGELPATADLWRSLSVLNIVAVLIATIGGFSSLIALLVTPQIRTYSRMNVIIGFLALFASVLLFDRFSDRYPRLAKGILPFIVAFGLLDQATPAAVRRYSAVKRQYDSDADIVRRIEATLPAKSIVFELPYVSYPEEPRVHRMDNYDPIRPYLHSRSLRWTFPTMRGRMPDAWVRTVSRLEPKAMLAALSGAGIAGVLVDRDGYEDAGAAIESDLRALLGRDPLVSRNGALAFFDMRGYAFSCDAGAAPADCARQRDIASHPVVANWTGCYEDAVIDGKRFQWCKGRGELTLDNDAAVARRVSLRARIIAGQPPSRVALKGDVLSEDVPLPRDGTAFSRELELPPGRHVVRFQCDTGPIVAPGDPRSLIWRMEDFGVTDAGEPPR